MPIRRAVQAAPQVAINETGPFAQGKLGRTFRRKLPLALLPLSGYLLFSLTALSLPGLHYDEVLFSNAAMGNLDGSFVRWEVTIAGKQIPLMLMSYLGSLKAWLYAPIFALFGPNPISTRLPVVLLGLVSLIVTYKFVRKFFDDRVAICSLMLMSFDPTFIFSNRLDWGPMALGMLLKASALYLLWIWLETGRLRYLFCASFLLGLGVFDKVTFAWFVVSLAVALPLCFFKSLRALVNRRILLAAAAFFLLGCAPLVAFNIKFPLTTFHEQKGITPTWKDALVYRYGLFKSTLDGTAVHQMVDNRNPVPFAETIAGSTIDSRLSTFLLPALRFFLPAQDFVPEALVLSLIFLLLLWTLGRLGHKPRVLFLVLQLAIITTFVCATAQASGPHHAAMILPFSHILVAVAACECLRMCEGLRLFGAIRCKTPAVAAFSMVLIVPQIAIDASYLKAFEERGGAAVWSDAIYELADYARSRPDRNLLLMDWGFNNQLLLLSAGTIQKEEVFVQLLDRQSDEERITALEPYLINPKNLFVFHVSGCDTFPLHEIFKGALERNRLGSRIVKTFYQRDRQPIYVMYEVVAAETPLTERATDRVAYYFREAEDWDEKSGGNLDWKGGASNRKALGEFWGKNASDFAVYRFSLPHRILNAYFTVRYAFEAVSSQRYHVLLDDNYVDAIILQTTGGFGYTPDQWRLQAVRLGTLEAGPHEIRLKPAPPSQAVNLDCFYVTNGRPSTDAPNLGRFAGLVHSRRPVAIEVAPGEVVAGKDTLRLKVVGLDAPAMDLLYRLNGKDMPPIYGWRLDGNHTATVFVDRNTRKGVYRYLSVRDARDPSPEGWIPVDVRVRVK